MPPLELNLTAIQKARAGTLDGPAGDDEAVDVRMKGEIARPCM